MNQTSMKRHDRSSEPLAIQNHWYLVSIHGAVLFYIAVYPEFTIRQIADEMALTQRTVWGVIGDLRRTGSTHPVLDGHRFENDAVLAVPLPPSRLADPIECTVDSAAFGRHHR